MTEDEAKSKWCPAVRLTASGSGEWHVNRPPGSRPDNREDYMCLGSACMAWRVAVKPSRGENAYNTPEPPPGDDWQPASPSPKNMAWWRVIPEQHIGYCGLAGPVQ